MRGSAIGAYRFACRPGTPRWTLALIAAILGLGLIAFTSGTASAGNTTFSQYGDRSVQVYLDDLPVAFPISPFLDGGTTMVPLRAISEALGFTVTWNESGTVTCRKGVTTITLSLGAANVVVNSAEVTLPRAPFLAGGHTVVPLRFFSEAMGYAVEWDASTYTAWVTSPKSRMPVWGFYALGSSEYSSWEDLFGQTYPYPLMPTAESPASQVAGAFLGWFSIDREGRVTDRISADCPFHRPDGWEAVMMRLAAAKADAVAMFYADNAGGKLSDLLGDPVKRDHLAFSIAQTATSFSGAALDFEELGADPNRREEDAANFTLFLESLDTYLRDKTLTVVVHPLNGHYLGYDHSRIGEIADSVVLMAYGYEEPGKPTPTAPWNRVDEAIRLELEKVPAEKLILGVPAYGTVYAVTEQSTSDGATATIPGQVTPGQATPNQATPNQVTKVLRPAARDAVGPGVEPARDAVGPGVEPAYDPQLSCGYSTWESEGVTYHAFTESNRSLAARVALAKRYNLAGVAIWRLGLLQDGWLDAVLDVAEPLR